MTLTKAELADLLFEQLGLNKREAKDMVERFSRKSGLPSNPATASNCPASATFSSAKNPSGLDAIRRPVRKSPLPRGAS